MPEDENASTLVTPEEKAVEQAKLIWTDDDFVPVIQSFVPLPTDTPEKPSLLCSTSAVFQKVVSLWNFKNSRFLTVESRKKDKLWKIGPWLQMFLQAYFRKLPEQNHCVDDIICFEGRSRLRQFIRNRPTR